MGTNLISLTSQDQLTAAREERTTGAGRGGTWGSEETVTVVWAGEDSLDRDRDITNLREPGGTAHQLMVRCSGVVGLRGAAGKGALAYTAK